MPGSRLVPTQWVHNHHYIAIAPHYTVLHRIGRHSLPHSYTSLSLLLLLLLLGSGSGVFDLLFDDGTV